MIIAIDARSLENNKTGVSRYLTGLLGCWKNNKDCKFILYFKDKIPQNDLLDNDIFELKLLKNNFGFSSNFLFQHFLLPFYLKKNKVDFLFSPFYLKPFFCPIPSSIVLHDISYEAHPEWFDFKSQFFLKLLSKFSAKNAYKIFTVSNYSKSEIIKYYHLNSEKITVTYLAPDDGFQKINDLDKIKTIKEKYGIKKKFIFCVGTIFTRRHIPKIIKAFEKISEKCNDYQLVLVGKNITHPFVDIDKKIKIINQKFREKKTIHLDFISEEELLIFYSLCDFVIYLSDYEGFGLPVIEAQFFGKAVITSYNSSLIEVGNNSVEFTKENSVVEIYNSFEKIIFNDSYKASLIENGLENIKRFSWENCAKETIDVLLNN